MKQNLNKFNHTEKTLTRARANKKETVKLTKITSIREMHTHQNDFHFWNVINRIDSRLLILNIFFFHFFDFIQ